MLSELGSISIDDAAGTCDKWKQDSSSLKVPTDLFMWLVSECSLLNMMIVRETTVDASLNLQIEVCQISPHKATLSHCLSVKYMKCFFISLLGSSGPAYSYYLFPYCFLKISPYNSFYSVHFYIDSKGPTEKKSRNQVALFPLKRTISCQTSLG